MNFITDFERHVKEKPSQTALIYEDEEFSYGRLGDLINRFSNGLKRLGVVPGDRVALMMNNRPEFVIPYYATVKIGAIIVPLNTFLMAEELKYQLNDVGAKVLVGNDWCAPEFLKIRGEVPTVQHFISTIDVEGGIKFDDFVASASPDLALYDSHDDDAAVIKYTSGTMGKPKGVIQTHRNVYLFIKANMQVYEVTTEIRPLLFVPLYHGFGDHCALNLTFMAGTSIVIMDPFHPDKILDAIQKHKCSYFGAIPSMLYALATYEEADKYDTSSLDRVLTGGGPVTREVIETFEKRFGVQVLQGYGLAEGLAGYTYTRIDMPYKEGSTGVPLPGVEIKIVDDEGKELPPREVGEIVARTDFNMKGYWNNPEATKETVKGGWLYTGDVGYLDEEGYLYIVDRKKDMIIMSGENIYPSEIEDILMRHPAIMDAAVMGAPDPRRGEVPMAVVVVKPGETLTEQGVVDFCKGQMSSFKVPKMVKFRDSLPRSANLKVLKRELRKEYFGT